MKFLAWLFVLLTLASTPYYAQQTHESWVRARVEAHTVKIQGLTGTGTGFAVEAPSGKVYIVTNRHVCELKQMWVVSPRLDPKRTWKTRILEVSEDTDLCLLEAPGYLGDGLELSGSDPEYGEGLAVIGHPAGSAKPVLSRGEFLENTKVWHPWEEITSDAELEWCSTAPERAPVITFFGSWCLKRINSYLTTIQIFPGNSGSAVVNKWGNVVGVVWGSSSSTNYGVVVPLGELQEFLSVY